MQPDKAGTASAFPADHLVGAKADRVTETKDGLTALAAIRLLFPVPDANWMEAEYDKRLGEEWRMSSFKDLLKKGSWHGKGFRVPVDPTARRERIPPEKWDILGIDLDDNSASGSGLKYAGLRFYEKKKVGKSLSRERVRRAELERFMEKRIADLKDAGGRSSARQDEQAARKHFKGHSIPRAWIQVFREEFNVPLEWSKPGRRK